MRQWLALQSWQRPLIECGYCGERVPAKDYNFDFDMCNSCYEEETAEWLAAVSGGHIIERAA